MARAVGRRRWSASSVAGGAPPRHGAAGWPGAAMEGKEIRFGVPPSALFAASTTGTSTGAVNSFHDSFTALGGGLTMLQHDARRGRARRRRLRPLRDPGAGGRHGVRRRADGRAHPGVPGQEDQRAARSSSSPCYILTTPALVLIGTGARDGAAAARGSRSSTPARTGCPRCSTPSRRRPTTTARRSPGCRRTPTSTTPRSGWRCCSAGSCRSCSCSAWPARWPRSSRSRRPPGTLPTHRPLFVGMLVGVVVIVAGLTYFPALALGPLAEGLH